MSAETIHAGATPAQLRAIILNLRAELACQALRHSHEQAQAAKRARRMTGVRE